MEESQRDDPSFEVIRWLATHHDELATVKKAGPKNTWGRWGQPLPYDRGSSCMIKSCHMTALPGECLCQEHYDFYVVKCSGCGRILTRDESIDRRMCARCWRKTPEFNEIRRRFDRFKRAASKKGQLIDRVVA